MIAALLAALAVETGITIGLLLMLLDSRRLAALVVDERTAILERAAREREQMTAAHRGEMRELLNRIQHPDRMPTGHRPIAPALPEQRRADWNRVGVAEPLAGEVP